MEQEQKIILEEENPLEASFERLQRVLRQQYQEICINYPEINPLLKIRAISN